MKKTLYLFAAGIVLTCVLCGTALAQQDSSRLDLGHTSLNRKFTQTVTIRGADLEKMPFTSLSDALRPWLYGAWTQDGAIQYVVDGNPVVDVNAYSIQDIEEVVLVQDASAILAGGVGQQEMVLITTKRGKGKQGLALQAQTGFINSNGDGVKTETRMYHSYQVNAYHNWDKFSAGISAGWQRDATPLVKDTAVKISEPYDLKRWRLGGYFDWRIDAHNLVEATINYAPEKEGVAGTNGSFYDLSRKARQKYIVPGLRWTSELLPGLKNDLRGSYLSTTYEESDLQFTKTIPAAATNTEADMHAKIWWGRDRLVYTINAGDWRLEPAVTYSYENYKWNLSTFSATTYGGPGSQLPPGSITSTSSLYWPGTKISLLVPGLNINWKDLVNAQFGVVSILSLHNGKGTLPYASAAFDILRMAGVKVGNSLKLFGSWSQRNSLVFSSRISDIGSESTLNQLIPTLPGTVQFGQSGGTGGGPFYQADPNAAPITYWAWTAGATYSLKNDRLHIQYMLERRNVDQSVLVSQVPLGNPYGNPVRVIAKYRSTLHHFDIRAKIMDNKDLRWETGLNLTLLGTNADSLGKQVQLKPQLGDGWLGGYSPTGGWVNRLQLQRFTAGLDILYHFSEAIYTNGGVSGHHSSIIVPNLYIGYSWHTFGLYAECRGLIRNSKQDLMDSRRFYTIGGKWSL